MNSDEFQRLDPAQRKTFGSKERKAKLWFPQLVKKGIVILTSLIDLLLRMPILNEYISYSKCCASDEPIREDIPA